MSVFANDAALLLVDAQVFGMGLVLEMGMGAGSVGMVLGMGSGSAGRVVALVMAFGGNSPLGFCPPRMSRRASTPTNSNQLVICRTVHAAQQFE